MTQGLQTEKNKRDSRVDEELVPGVGVEPT